MTDAQPIKVDLMTAERLYDENQQAYWRTSIMVEAPTDEASFEVSWRWPGELDAVDVVRIARNAFLQMMKSLAQSTRAWEMSREEVAHILQAT